RCGKKRHPGVAVLPFPYPHREAIGRSHNRQRHNHPRSQANAECREGGQLKTLPLQPDHCGQLQDHPDEPASHSEEGENDSMSEFVHKMSSKIRLLWSKIVTRAMKETTARSGAIDKVAGKPRQP